MPETTETAWPEGVVARYLTAGGATVDLTNGSRRYPTDDGIGEDRNHISAACTGCWAASEFSHWRTVRGDFSAYSKHDPEAANEQARAWAQAHAEKCRAMPRPTA